MEQQQQPRQLAVEWVPIGDLFGNPANPRINDQAVEPVAASLRRFGWQQPLVAPPAWCQVTGPLFPTRPRWTSLAELAVDLTSRTLTPSGGAGGGLPRQARPGYHGATCHRRSAGRPEPRTYRRRPKSVQHTQMLAPPETARDSVRHTFSFADLAAAIKDHRRMFLTITAIAISIIAPSCKSYGEPGPTVPMSSFEWQDLERGLHDLALRLEKDESPQLAKFLSRFEQSNSAIEDLSQAEIAELAELLFLSELQSEVHFVTTGGPKAYVYYRLITRSITWRCDRATETTQVLPVGIYEFWSERGGRRTSQVMRHMIVARTVELEIEELP